jgi:hypothetical protein
LSHHLSFADACHQASSDSDELDRPFKKPSHHVSEPDSSCSHPSFVGEDDDTYEEEIEEEELIPDAPIGCTKPGTRKKNANTTSLSSRTASRQAAPTGVVVSMANPITSGREPNNYLEYEPSDYTILRRDVNQFTLPSNAIDPRFRTLVQ